MPGYDPTQCIAIIGAAGRFPAASSIEAFWDNIKSERDCFTEYTIDDVVAAGLPRELVEAPDYVRRCPTVPDALTLYPDLLECSIDAAAQIDPQSQMMLICVADALKRADGDPRTVDGSIGIWSGSSFSDYFLKDLVARFGPFPGLPDLYYQSPQGSLSGFIARRFDLTGPAVVVQTACSTSLVAVHMACEALLTYQCDMALAGGVSLQYARVPGYVYKEGEIFSPDGYCRTFDKDANGTVLGDGCGVVVLRRLEEAIADGDEILAVVTGSAVNNDGSARAGFTAPGVNGQVELLLAAYNNAGVTPEQIGYIETHGTGTQLGDPLEVTALTQAFRQSTSERAFCALGATKASVGHLDAAAGVTGLIKTVCALKDQYLPRVQNYTEPNPGLNLSTSPFFVVDQLMPWKPRDGRRIAGVSSFGLGGTNAHVVIEEYVG